MKFKHLLFDLDGTILDTLEAITFALNVTTEHFNLGIKLTKEEVKVNLGRGTPYLIKNCFKNDNLDYDNLLIPFFIEQQLDAHKKYCKLFPNLKDELILLKNQGYKLYVATNKPQKVASFIIPYLYGDNFFEFIQGQDKNIKKKPDPEVINIIVKKFNLNKDECLYIGDSIVDLETAKNANMKSCLVKYGFDDYSKINKSKIIYSINNPKELKDIL